MENQGAEYQNRDLKVAAAESRARVMQNPLILDLVAKSMPADDLRSLRVTATFWNRIFLPSLRDKQQFLKLSCKPNVPEDAGQSSSPRSHRMRPTRTNNPRTMRDWIQVMAPRTRNEVPVTKFRLHNLHHFLPDDRRAFFGLCGSSISHLDVELEWGSKPGHVADEVGKVRRIIFGLAPNLVGFRFRVGGNSGTGATSVATGLVPPDRDLPNLRHLEFNVVQNTEGVHSAIRDFLASLLRHATHLESLSLANEHNVKNLLVLTALKDRHTLSRLTTLRIYKLDVPELEVLIELSSRGLLLRVLSTSIEYTSQHNHTMVAQMLYSFLESQSATLRHFSFMFRPGYLGHAITTIPPTIRIELPALPAVHTFQLTCHGLVAEHNQLLANRLELTFPQLVRFEYVNTRNNFDDDMRGIGHSGPTLTDLSLNTNYSRGTGVGNTFVQTYGSRFQFQSLTRLEINMKIGRCEEVFPQIFIGLPALEVLHIFCKGMRRPDIVHLSRYGEDREGHPVLELDHLLTGIPSYNLGELRRILDVQGPLGLLTSDALQTLLREYKMEPGIQDLRCLKEFVLDVSTCFYHITNIGGYFGFSCASKTIQQVHMKCFKQTEDDYDRMGPTRPPARRRHVGTHATIENQISDRCQAMLHTIWGPGAVISI